jgi:hypothetical protein
MDIPQAHPGSERLAEVKDSMLRLRLTNHDPKRIVPIKYARNTARSIPVRVPI